MGKRSTRAMAVTVGFLLLASFAGGEAQGQGVRLIPKAGLHVSVNDFGELRQEGAPGAVELGRKSATAALGIGAEVNPPFLPFGARATVTYGTASPIPYVTEDCLDCRTRGDLLVATATGVFRPLPRLLVARPYLLGGGGIRRFGFDRSELVEEGVEGVLRDQTGPVAHVGGGLDLELDLLTAVIEVAGVVGRFEPGGGMRDGQPVPSGSRETMTDVFVTAGLSFDL